MILAEILGSVLDVVRNGRDDWRQVLALRCFRKKFVAKFRTNLSPGRQFDLAVLRRVGRHSYGSLNVAGYGLPDESLEIGEFVSIAPHVVFHLGGEHPLDRLSTFPFDTFIFGEVALNRTKGSIIVHDDVWIGTRALILSGVEIGQGAVVGAGSVVAKSVPPYSVVVGNPARVIKYRFSPEIIELLCKRLNYQLLTEDMIKRIRPLLDASLDRARLEEIFCAIGC